MLAAGWFAFHRATEALQTATHAVLRAASDGAEAQLREFLSSLKRTTESLGADPEIRANLEGHSDRAVDMTQLLARVRNRVPEARAIFWMNLQGRVVSSSGQQFQGKEEAGSPIFDSGRQSFYPGDVVRDSKAGDLQWTMSAPVKDPRTEQVLGVVGLEVDPDVLSAVTTGGRDLQEGSDTQSFRIGQTGETYLVNRGGFMLTESRFIPNAVLRVKVETKPVLAAVQLGQEIIGDYSDYRAVPVSGASAILRDRGWVLLTEIDFSQEFVPIRRLRNLLILLSIMVGFAAVLIARRFARGIVDPLRMLETADRALMRNDIASGLVSEQRLPPDEIGDAIRKRNSRVRELLQHQEALLAQQRAR